MERGMYLILGLHYVMLRLINCERNWNYFSYLHVKKYGNY